MLRAAGARDGAAPRYDGTILDEIAAYTRERVAGEKAAARGLPPPGAVCAARGFPFERALSSEGLSFICEVKKASPSRGVIAEDFPYREIAKSYEAAGAAALSVLTEPRWFLGSAGHLRAVADAVDIPVLRKDFVVDEYQIREAASLGASAVLLIVAILSDSELPDFLGLADELGLSALVEVHDERETERALKAGARVIGVNNRDLRTFKVDPSNSLRLRSRVPEIILFVAESGVAGPDDIRALAPARPDAALIGEAMMRAEDKAAFLKSLKEASRETFGL
jgi:indole-3-glycerol phosphate synthase